MSLTKPSLTLYSYIVQTQVRAIGDHDTYGGFQCGDCDIQECQVQCLGKYAYGLHDFGKCIAMFIGSFSGSVCMYMCVTSCVCDSCMCVCCLYLSGMVVCGVSQSCM